MPTGSIDPQDLGVGDIVEVRSKSEILATLDENGSLEALPFMPEMLKYCGQRFRVFKRAHKTCDTINKTGLRKMNKAVHLEGVRCDGAAHGGCQAACLIFWKEAWIKRVAPNKHSALKKEVCLSSTQDSELLAKKLCSEDALHFATQKKAGTPVPAEKLFSCQATELFRATSCVPWWDIRHYLLDIRSGNVPLLVALVKGLRMMLISIFNAIQEMRGGRVYPFLAGHLIKTPAVTLNLNPGELVQIRSKKEIISTLNANKENRGLSFDIEMARYCGGQFKVLARVERLIDERTGRMRSISNDCIILDGVTCCGDLSHRRLFCPRNIYPFWREIWLKRVG